MLNGIPFDHLLGGTHGLRHEQRSNKMNRFLVMILVLGLVAMDGCEKKEGSAGESVGKNRSVPVSKGETEANPEPGPLTGEIGSSSRWGSGWLDLATVADFAAGDVLRLRIGGTAGKVFVRLLPEGQFPDSSAGIIGGPITVPENRIVEVALDSARENIVQISVHGGPKPWGKFPLGGGNGPATLESATLVRR